MAILSMTSWQSHSLQFLKHTQFHPVCIVTVISHSTISIHFTLITITDITIINNTTMWSFLILQCCVSLMVCQLGWSTGTGKPVGFAMQVPWVQVQCWICQPTPTPYPSQVTHGI